jgi:hypothetical protein
VLDQGAEGGQQDRQALALLRAADEEDPQLLGGRGRLARRRVDVDPVGDDRVVAAVPAAAGPGCGLGHGDPGREAVEEAAGADRVGDVVGQGPGRVGMEGADHGRPRAEGGVPADQRHQRLVDVDHVEAAAAHLAARRHDATGREGGEVGDGAVGAEAGGAPERRQVLGRVVRFGARPVQQATDPAWRIEGSEHADVVAPREKLLRERLHVPVHAPLVRPGIWRDETYAHEGLRVDHPSARSSPLGGLSAQAKPTKTSR